MDIEEKEINDRLNRIEAKLDELISLSKSCEDSCKNMDQHIDFINNTYDGLKHPLDFLQLLNNHLILIQQSQLEVRNRRI